MLPRHLRSLISTNTPLSDEQLRMVTARRRQLSDEQVNLTDELSGLRTWKPRRTAVEEKLAEIDQELQECSILLAPIRRLPDDVLAELFLHCPNAYPISPERSRAVLLICSVSSSWRKLAFSTPRLWTSLCLVLPNLDESDRKYRQALHEASNWLRRSGNNLPLSLRLDVKIRDTQDTDNTFNVKCIHTVLAILAPIMSRLRHLDFGRCFVPEILVRILAASTFFNTQSVTIRSDAHSHSLNLFNAKSNRSGSSIWPSLRRLVFDRGLLSTSISGFPLPWSQLTHLSVEYLDDHLWSDLLSNCLQLQYGSFHFQGRAFNFLDEQDLPRVTLPHLHDLTLTFAYPVNPGVLGRFELPSLVTLRLGSSAPDIMNLWNIQHYSNNFLLQIKSLRHLALVKEWPINIELFQLLLRNTPDLKTLELCVDLDLSTIFNVLEHSENSLNLNPEVEALCLVPELRTIVIDVVFYYAYSDTMTLGSFPLEELKAFIQSRLVEGRQYQSIQSCRMFVSNHVKEDKYEIQRLREALRSIDPYRLSTQLIVCPKKTSRGWRDRLPDSLSGLDYN